MIFGNWLTVSQFEIKTALVNGQAISARSVASSTSSMDYATVPRTYRLRVARIVGALNESCYSDDDSLGEF